MKIKVSIFLALTLLLSACATQRASETGLPLVQHRVTPATEVASLSDLLAPQSASADSGSSESKSTCSGGAAVSNQFVSALSTACAATLAQPSCANLTGAAASCGTNATELTAGTVPAAQMPALTGDCTTSSGAVATTCTQAGGGTGNYRVGSLGVGVAAPGTAGDATINNSLGVGTAADGVAGDIVMPNSTASNDLRIKDFGGTTRNILSFGGSSANNLAIGNGVAGNGQWGAGTPFEGTNGTGSDWRLSRTCDGTNPGICFGTVNVAPDTSLVRTGVATAKLTGSLATTSFINSVTAAGISGGGALSTGSNAFAGTITGLAATGNVLTPGFTCANAVVAVFEDDTTVGGVKITARTTTTVTFSATAADTADYIASCR